jgi:hypothetical protein
MLYYDFSLVACFIKLANVNDPTSLKENLIWSNILPAASASGDANLPGAVAPFLL